MEQRLSQVRTRIARKEDIYRLLGNHSRKFLIDYPKWALVVGERNGAIIGMGGVVWDVTDLCWAINYYPSARHALTLHRTARYLLQRAQEIEDQILAVRDSSKPSSKRWLTRLGFQFYEMWEEGEVWRWVRQPSSLD